MLDIIAAQAPGQCQIFFNISKPVGVSCPNDAIEVELVQLGYFCMAINPANNHPPDAKAIYALVKPGTGYSGLPSDPLSRAIEAHEKFRKIRPDGHVSRMTGAPSYHNGPRGTEPFLLASLCNNIFDIMSDVYPRIDLDSRTPSSLAFHVKRLLRN